MTETESIWVALEPVALGVGWFTIAVLVAWTIAAVIADIARQVNDARRARWDDTAAWRASQRCRQEDADRVPDFDMEDYR